MNIYLLTWWIQIWYIAFRTLIHLLNNSKTKYNHNNVWNIKCTVDRQTTGVLSSRTLLLLENRYRTGNTRDTTYEEETRGDSTRSLCDPVRTQCCRTESGSLRARRCGAKIYAVTVRRLFVPFLSVQLSRTTFGKHSENMIELEIMILQQDIVMDRLLISRTKRDQVPRKIFSW